MARGRRFAAAFYSNCDACEEVIEPGDTAGYAQGYERALCELCLDEAEDNDVDDEPTRWDDVR